VIAMIFPNYLTALLLQVQKEGRIKTKEGTEGKQETKDRSSYFNPSSTILSCFRNEEASKWFQARAFSICENSSTSARKSKNKAAHSITKAAKPQPIFLIKWKWNPS